MYTLRWSEGVNNFMTYVTGDLPVGAYDRTSLANTGIGHYALDGGVGYTYLDQQNGHELTAVAGFTNNYTNPYTNYKNGVDFHLDWGASQFLSKQFLSARSATCITSSPATAGVVTMSAHSCRASSASARRSDTSFRSEILRVT